MRKYVPLLRNCASRLCACAPHAAATSCTSARRSQGCRTPHSSRHELSPWRSARPCGASFPSLRRTSSTSSRCMSRAVRLAPCLLTPQPQPRLTVALHCARNPVFAVVRHAFGAGDRYHHSAAGSHQPCRLLDYQLPAACQRRAQRRPDVWLGRPGRLRVPKRLRGVLPITVVACQGHAAGGRLPVGHVHGCGCPRQHVHQLQPPGRERCDVGCVPQ